MHTSNGVSNGVSDKVPLGYISTGEIAEQLSMTREAVQRRLKGAGLLGAGIRNNRSMHYSPAQVATIKGIVTGSSTHENRRPNEGELAKAKALGWIPLSEMAKLLKGAKKSILTTCVARGIPVARVGLWWFCKESDKYKFKAPKTRPKKLDKPREPVVVNLDLATTSPKSGAQKAAETKRRMRARPARPMPRTMGFPEIIQIHLSEPERAEFARHFAENKQRLTAAEDRNRPLIYAELTEEDFVKEAAKLTLRRQ